VKRVRLAQLFLATASLIMTACGLLAGNQGGLLGHQVQLPPQSEAVLVCSQECADRGWCGTTSDQRQVVLGNAITPADPFPDRLFSLDSRVNINQVGVATLEQVVSGEQSELPFYHVISLQEGKSAWIAGWCIAAPPQS
jgi:hypothetical protein